MSDGCDYFLVIEKGRVHEKCRVFIYMIQTHVPRITFKNKWLHNIVALKARRTFCLASVNNLTGKWTSQVNIFTLMHQFQYFWTTTQSGLQSAPQTHTHSSIIATNFSQSHYISTLIIKNVNDFFIGTNLTKSSSTETCWWWGQGEGRRLKTGCELLHIWTNTL